jgi:hypothetical protein
MEIRSGVGPFQPQEISNVYFVAFYGKKGFYIPATSLNARLVKIGSGSKFI